MEYGLVNVQSGLLACEEVALLCPRNRFRGARAVVEFQLCREFQLAIIAVSETNDGHRMWTIPTSTCTTAHQGLGTSLHYKSVSIVVRKRQEESRPLSELRALQKCVRLVDLTIEYETRAPYGMPLNPCELLAFVRTIGNTSMPVDGRCVSRELERGGNSVQRFTCIVREHDVACRVF